MRHSIAAISMIAALVVSLAIFTVGGAHVLNSVFPLNYSVKKEKPVYCFYLDGREDPSACRQFGGLKKVKWESECVPDPNCTKLPDGTDYLKE